MNETKQVKLEEFIKEDKFELQSYLSQLLNQSSYYAPVHAEN